MELVDVLAKIDEHLARQDSILDTMDSRLLHMDALATERAAQHERTMARLAEILAHAHAESAAAAEAERQALAAWDAVPLHETMHRFLATAERVLAAWERQAGTGATP